MDDIYVCKLNNCGNKNENKDNICCYSCDVEGYKLRCDENFKECKFK